MDIFLFVVIFILPAILFGLVIYSLFANNVYIKFKAKYQERLYIKCASNPYLLYKKLRPCKPMDMRNWIFKYILFDYLKFSHCQIITYNELVKYIEALIKVSKQLVFKDKQLLDMQSSAFMSEEDIYEFVYKEILKVLDSELCCSNFQKLIGSNASDFISFLDRNRPSSIPPLEECPRNKISYYACIGNIKSHLGLA